ncbi:F-box/LRR-repeat protein 2-like [Symsagittifera roscoffensis]|uniref:F-box/LRR-repeat protein 2-like n=1 Tax=Symsagittifera roscoffensis TaxID=84072 RepID=UPI00307B3144
MELSNRNGHSNGAIQYQNGNSVHSSNGTVTNYRIESRSISSINDDRIPREIFFRVFSFLDLTSLCRCAGVCKKWRELVKDGKNWQVLDLFSFQIAVESNVIKSLSRRAGPFLKSLNLKGCKNIGDSAIRIFAENCNQIEELNLRECRDITDRACEALGDYAKHLKTLNLDSCDKISDSSLISVGRGCANLEDVDLSWNKHISHVGFAALTSGCPNILRLRCAGVDKFNDACMTLIGQNLNRLIVINVLKCARVTDEGVTRVCEGCPLLETMCLSQIPHISDQSLLALGHNCPNIRNLELNSCAAITDVGFSHLTRNRTEEHLLEKLDVEECNHLTDATLQNFAANCPYIREMILSHCDQITDEGIRALCESAGVQQCLEKIKLDNCPQVSDASLDFLCLCNNLKEIDLFDCQLITRPGIASLRARLPHINVHAYFAPATPPIPEFRGRRKCCCCVL